MFLRVRNSSNIVEFINLSHVVRIKHDEDCYRIIMNVPHENNHNPTRKISYYEYFKGNIGYEDIKNYLNTTIQFLRVSDNFFINFDFIVKIKCYKNNCRIVLNYPYGDNENRLLYYTYEKHSNEYNNIIKYLT
jgi:hypothetical protein